MRVAIIGGGINGIMSAWQTRLAGYSVDLYERGSLMSETSSASSKLLHGGLRYLESGHIAMVREGLRERAWWLRAAPHLTNTVKLFLPVYTNSPRRRATLQAGLILYDLLAGRNDMPRHKWWPAQTLPADAEPLRREHLHGVFEYHDGQMDDHALGLWAATQAQDAGVTIYENSDISRIRGDGGVLLQDQWLTYDVVVNATGPWAARLLEISQIATRWRLDLVRGSHLQLRRRLDAGFVIQHHGDRRIVFILPYKGETLVGTTEVRQQLAETPRCSDAERAYLLDGFNSIIQHTATPNDVVATFAGVRPLVERGQTPSAQPREAVLEQTGRVISIFGGKWTSARALGGRVATLVSASSLSQQP